MRITLDVDDPILREMKVLRERQRRSMGAIVSELLAEALARRRPSRVPLPLCWVSRPMKSLVNLADRTRLVFTDESWTETNMAPMRGWAPRVERLGSKVPYGRWNTITFIAALRCDRIAAPWVLDRPITADRLLAYVENALAPTLRPNDMVIADNLPSHRRPDIRAVIRKLGAKLLFATEILAGPEPLPQASVALAAMLCRWL